MKRFRVIFIIVGLGILALMIYGFGLKKTIDDIIALSWKFWIIVSIFLINNIFMTYAWRVLINQPLSISYFFNLLLARIAGDSTSSINALASAAGEAIKAMYIKDVVPLKTGLASVVLDRTIHILSNILMMLTGIFVSFFALNLPLYYSITITIVVILALFGVIILLKKQKEGFVKYLLNKIPRKLLDRLMNDERWEKIRKLDEEIGFIFSSKDNMNHFYISLAIHYFSGLIASSLEVYLIIIYSGKPVTFIHSMFTYIFSMFITSIIFFMPANIGTSEGSYSLALKMLGYDPALGLTIGIVRRLRTFVWSGIGILILFHAGLMKKEQEDPA